MESIKKEDVLHYYNPISSHKKNFSSIEQVVLPLQENSRSRRQNQTSKHVGTAAAKGKRSVVVPMDVAIEESKEFGMQEMSNLDRMCTNEQDYQI